MRKDDDDWVISCNLEVEEPGKMDKNLHDLLIKLKDAVHRYKWKEMIRGKWSDSCQLKTNCTILTEINLK